MNYVSRFLLCILLWASSGSAQTLRIYHIDVEQASSTLFVTPGGKTLLVDSGKNGHGGRVKAVMDQAGVTKVDYFVCTHYHEDHYGGIDDLVNLGVPVLEAYDRGEKQRLSAQKRSEPAYRGYQAAVGEDAIRMTPGMTIPLDPTMTVICVSSGGAVLGESNSTRGVDENDMSVSLLVTFGPFRYFIGGDIEKSTEAKIAARDLVKDVNVYVADHHGSNTSSLQSFMEDLEPQVIVISNGNNATYKHPRKTTLNLYATLHGPPTVFQTNKYLLGGVGGNVPDQFIGDPETVDQDGTILVTVNLATGKYRVSYGANTSREFQLSGASASPLVVIESLLPNPAGPDESAELVVLKNKGSSPVMLAGWHLEDRSGLEWTLSNDGTIGVGQSRTIRRNGRPMSLNNGGDEIRLLDPAGAVQDHFEYTSSSEGPSISTGH